MLVMALPNVLLLLVSSVTPSHMPGMSNSGEIGGSQNN
jgi:hypothetical protein